ncbi:MAG: NAD(P)/FAD-dependent oxidoreductase [Candidatus Binatia bacterium]
MSSASVSNPSLRVAVVGAGFAGLAAAWRLVQAGIGVTVFERSGHVGGLAMTFPFAGTEIEKYYHHWFTSDVDILGLLGELGLERRLRWISPVMGMFCQGRIYRFTSPVDLLRFRPFSLPAKIRFGLVTLFLQRYPRREPFEGVTASEWLLRYAGREVYETVWGPLLRAKFGRHAESISMAWIWSKMRLRGNSRTGAGSRESLGYLDGGFGIAARALRDSIARCGGRLHLGERVERMRPLDGFADRFEVETSRRRERFSAVISTVAPPLLAGLVPELPAETRRQCEGIEHAAILCTMLILRRRFSPIYWMNVSDRDVPFGGLIEHTNFLSPEHYQGRHVVYVSHYTYPDEPVYGMDASELLRHYLPALKRIRPEFDESWLEDRMAFRDRFAQPIVTADYHRRLLPIEMPIAGLYAATMSQVYPEDRGTNYAVRIGNQAARMLLESDFSREAAEPRLVSRSGS